MNPAQAVLAVVFAVNEYARWTEDRAAALDFPLSQARQGKAIPPAVVIDMIESQQQQLRRSGALHVFMVEMLIALFKANIGERENEPPVTWWSLLKRLFKHATSR